MEILGRHWENGEPVQITVDGERIQSVQPAWPHEDIRDWPWIAPGLFDMQINGYGGKWFSNAELTADDVLDILRPHFGFGITRMFPTLITASHEALARGFAAIREACEREKWADRLVAGCHLEGPYLSGEDGPRGAHPRSQIRPADWNEFQELQGISGNRIKLVTVAPEVEGVIDFIRQAVDSGVVISLGHTAASAEQIAAAVEAGARMSTHLGNGAHGTLRRHPNYIWEQLGNPWLTTGLITDGHHLPDSVIRSIVQAKLPRGCIITCDAAGLAGCPPGIYSEGEVAVEILESGRIVIAGQHQFLAGSGANTLQCITKAMQVLDLPFKEVWEMASRNPAILFGMEEIRLRRGARADLAIFEWDQKTSHLTMLATVAAGKLRYGSLPISVPAM